MFCEKCGQQLPDGSKFCAGCGAKQGDAAAPQQTAQATPPPPPQARVQTAPPPAPQQNYAAPPQQPYNPYMPKPQDTSPLSVGNYIVMYLLMIVPIVSIVMLFVWGFGSDVNLNKKNWARAMLIIAAIGIVLYILLFVLLGSLFASIFSSGYYGY